MLKNNYKWLWFATVSLILSMQTYAKTITLTTDNPIDYNFTKDYKLTYINDAFNVGNIKLKPFIAINSVETNFSKISKDIIMNDDGFEYEFGFNVTNMVISSVNYIGFDLSGLKRLDNISYTDGHIRIIFDDLKDKGNLTFSNNQVILYNPTSLSIDPSIQLLPSAINKAYWGNSLDTVCNGFNNPDLQATTELTDTQYNSTNVSDSNFYTTSTGTITFANCGWLNDMPTFNVSTVIGTNTVNWIQYCMEGKYTQGNSGSNGRGVYVGHKNITSGNWIVDNTFPTTSDTTYCYNFSSNTGHNYTSSEYNQLYNSTVNLKVAMETDSGSCVRVGGCTANTLSWNFANLTVSYTSTNTCTYGGSGDWFINCNDNCTLSSANTITGNIYIYGSNGFVNFQALQKAHAFYFNATNNCYWYYNNYRWLY